MRPATTPEKLIIPMVLFVLAAMMAGVLALAEHKEQAAHALQRVIMQAMERGYWCRAANRNIEDCQEEQRRRWKETE